MGDERREIKNKGPRWTRFTGHDALCVLYWILIFVTVDAIFDAPINLFSEFGIGTASRKFIFLTLLWVGTVTISQALMGLWGSLKGLLVFLLSPVTFTRVLLGFLNSSRVLIKKVFRLRLAKILFVVSLPITIVAGMTETAPALLTVVKFLIFIQMFFLMYATLYWIFNPIAPLENLKKHLNAGTRLRAVEMMTRIRVTSRGESEEKIRSHIRLLSAIPFFLKYMFRFVSGPSILFGVFLFFCVFDALFAVVGIATVFRIDDVISGQPSFSGNFFSGSAWDYTYVTVSQFLSIDLHGVQVEKKSALGWMVFLPMLAVALLTFLLSAFSTITQSRTEAVVSEFMKEADKLADAAIKKITEKPTVLLVDKEKKTDSKSDGKV